MNGLRGEALWRYRRAHGIVHPLAGRKVYGQTHTEKRQEQVERRYRCRLAELVLAGAITADELFVEETKLFQRRVRRQLALR